MEVHLDDSTINGLNFKNPACACFVANYCHNLVITNMNIDGAAGDKLGKNTDGIGVGASVNVRIINVTIHNQDDCFVTSEGKDILVDNLECTRGHGISIGTRGDGAKVDNFTFNVIIKNSKLIRTMVGVRIKTKLKFTGLIRNITFDNIELKDTSDYGVIIHDNYGPKGEPTPFPIEDITLRNVRGTIQKNATNIWIYVAAGARNWRFVGVKVQGGQGEKACKGIPNGLKVVCGKKG